MRGCLSSNLAMSVTGNPQCCNVCDREPPLLVYIKKPRNILTGSLFCFPPLKNSLSRRWRDVEEEKEKKEEERESVPTQSPKRHCPRQHPSFVLPHKTSTPNSVCMTHPQTETQTQALPSALTPTAMYEYPTPDLFLSSSSNSCHPFDMAPPPPTIIMPPPAFLPDQQLPSDAFDSIREALLALKSDNLAYNTCSSPPSSLPSYLQRSSTPIQRSVSSQTLRRDIFHPPFSPCDESMRRVFSTGDLQIINGWQGSRRSESPLGHENCSYETSMKVGRYSPEERRERIERYRSKRNQRNFQKKIKYACRKTLADSRPRIRGRFAKNEETGESSQSQWSQPGGDEDDEDDEAWINFLDAISMNLIP
ncbi:hypothetical protein ACLOJK_001609 [Asimina triloba]